VRVYWIDVSRVFTGVVYGVHFYGRGVSRVFTARCMECVSAGEVCLVCSLVGVWSACL